MEQRFDKYNVKKAKAERFVVIGGVLVIAAVLLFIASEMLAIPGLIAGVIGLVLLIIGFSNYQHVVSDFKNNFLTAMMNEWIEDGRYIPNQGLSAHQIYQTEFIKRADRFHSEDYIGGTIDGVSFVSSDVKLEERRVRHTKNGTQVYYVTYFRGRVFQFDFNKHFDGYLHVLETGSPTINRKYKKIKLESIDFNKKFTTFSTSDHSAFYVLTPHFMESLMKIEAKHPGKIGFSFIDTKMHVGINDGKDNFSIAMFRKIDDSLIDGFKQDVQIIYDLVDDLKLNKRIFKKE